MERREALHRYRTLRCAVSPCDRRNHRPAALHRGVVTTPGRASGGWSALRRVARTISELLAAGLSADGRSPGAARAPGVRNPQARGHRIPLHRHDASW